MEEIPLRIVRSVASTSAIRQAATADAIFEIEIDAAILDYDEAVVGRTASQVRNKRAHLAE
jgi:hypothetical protein